MKQLYRGRFYPCFPEPSCEVTYDLISDPDYGIPDSALTASSEYMEHLSAHGSRLDSEFAWEPEVNSDGEWISADLGENRIVMAIRTRGHVYVGHNYITQFTISISANGINWSDVVDESGSTVAFQGNTDAETIVTNPMPMPIVTRHVKLTVLDYVGWISLRWAIDGCPVL